MNLQDVFTVLKPDRSADSVPVTASIYSDLDQRYDNFHGHTLVSMYQFERDWGAWEKHPAGDEVVVLLSGQATMVIDLPDGERRETLRQSGDYVLVPRNTWHTALVDQPTQMLFITPGENTQHRSDTKFRSAKSS